jgi:nucleotide-binding universal stress UspA family protein
MSLKDLVVHLVAGRDHQPAANYAISVAATFDAHVAGAAVAFEPVIPATITGTIPVDVIEAQRVENTRAAQEVLDRFEQAAQRAGVSAETRLLDGTLPGSADTFARLARRFDLAVIGQAQRGQSGAEDLIIEGALFGSGRPVLVVPYIQKQGLRLERVVACWDGGRPAARAMGDALPFLGKAKKVDVVIVASEPGKGDEMTGINIGRHLSRHSVDVEIKRITTRDVDVASAILSYAADVSADFLVMGGYGHSRLREFILGGVTRSVLKAMTVPALMSH